MATDSRLEETDASPDEGRDEAASLGTPNPPRPPRPGKRSKGSGRIPIPLPPSRPAFEAVDADAERSDGLDAAPAVSIDERDEPSFPLVATRAKPASVPEESFADLDADLADSAPGEPAAPWRSVAPAASRPSEVTPPRGTPLVFRDDDERESEPEPTIVGKVAANLLQLSSGGDENTRAFTAPRELIELARRKREERMLAAPEPVESHAKVTARPPGRAARDDDDVTGDLPKVPAAPNVPAEGLGLPVPEADAPPVVRSHPSELDPASEQRPAARAPSSAPEIEIDPASELSPSARRAVLASTGKNVPISTQASTTPATSQRHWWLLFALFLVLGVVIARWRDIAALFR